MNRLFAALIGLSLCAPSGLAQSQRPTNTPPKGFVALFNGRDLSGWRGQERDLSPYKIAKWTPEEREAKQKEADADMKAHWKVENGEIVNDGHGFYLTTAKDYRDFEFWVDWRMMSPKTDSGVYLRGTPQVQIWDPNNEGEKKNGADRGSGALWNNKNEKEGRWPAVKADRPVGEWNTFHITMIGERVSVEFNGKKVVDWAVMENFWDRTKPMLASGPIQLQTHGGEMRFRNVFVREIPADEVGKRLAERSAEGFRPLFNGKNFEGWIGATDAYEISPEGVIRFKSGHGGNLLTKEQFSDFAIRFEFKLPPGGNNGLAVRTPPEGNPAFVGTELQILDDSHPKYKDLKPWQVHGSVYGIAPAHRGYLRPVGEWNYEEAIVKGRNIQVFVNGTKVVDADLDKCKPIDNEEHPGLKRTEGHVGFMGHGDPVEFRNIRLKTIKN